MSELETLRRQVYELEAFKEEASQEVVALNAEIAALTQDAKRYQWMRAHFKLHPEKWRLEWYLPRCYINKRLADQLDECIDSAMLAAAPKP